MNGRNPLFVAGAGRVDVSEEHSHPSPALCTRGGSATETNLGNHPVPGINSHSLVSGKMQCKDAGADLNASPGGSQTRWVISFRRILIRTGWTGAGF